MKRCNACGLLKEETEFSWKNMAKGVRNSRCKLCHKDYAAEHYRNNPQPYKDRAKKNNPLLRESNKQYIIDYLKCHPCVDCGEDDIDVLEFDHIELVGSKAIRVTMIRSSRKKLVEEISKCEVRCANCHTRRTRKQFGWERV